ncbi:MAG TPA: hypothetical protein VJN89_14735 [Candidatus Acidoferrum sp.]|nr:hypothetical protein [Candidatus Acidoferrum sp.]
MSSPDVWEILNGWKQAQLGIFMSWASSQENVSFSFEGRIVDADSQEISVESEPSERVAGTCKQRASVALCAAVLEVVRPERIRFSFPSGAVLEIVLS